jgi:hypothetical protein
LGRCTLPTRSVELVLTAVIPNGAVRLSCRRCRLVIGPDDPMVVVAVGTPATWLRPQAVLDNLEVAAGRWHWRCAPTAVRAYAPVFRPHGGGFGADLTVERLQALALATSADRATVWRRAPDGQAIVAIHWWVAHGIQAPSMALDTRQFPLIHEALIREGQLVFEHPQELPEPLRSEWLTIREPRVRDVRSLAAVSGPGGGIVLVNVSHHRRWTGGDLEMLREAVRDLDP